MSDPVRHLDRPTSRRAASPSLAAAQPAGRLDRVVSRSGAFAERLDRGRPRIAIVASPPATPRDLERVVDLRRRRGGAAHRPPQPAARRSTTGSRRCADGFDDALPSTIDPDELAGRLTLLDERARGRPARPTVAGGRRRRPRPGRPRGPPRRALVHLRPKEFQLLAMLASHPGRAYTRRQLLDRVWGPGTTATRARSTSTSAGCGPRSSPDPTAPVHLVTVRGVGYRLDPPIAWTPRTAEAPAARRSGSR